MPFWVRFEERGLDNNSRQVWTIKSVIADSENNQLCGR
jgi:hypothetical protein